MNITRHKHRIVAADEMSDFEITEDIDNIADQITDVQDNLDDVDEDDIEIETENNIVNHYIAECDSCHGIFISAMLESDQAVSKISGVCPICGKETDQFLNWIIRDADFEEDVIVEDTEPEPEPDTADVGDISSNEGESEEETKAALNEIAPD